MTTISVDGVSKVFRQYHESRPTTFTEILKSGFRQFRPSSEYWALHDVSFGIDSGKMFGIIGSNGAGKSTLLRLIGGIGKPNKGTIRTNGRIGAILDLGAGFHPDLTGRENLYINGVIGGLTRREIKHRLDQIVAFAEAESYIDHPLRTYSSGMHMRLAFSIAAHIDPQILLIDEILSVGDLAFQKKCLDRIKRFKEQGRTIVLVSHDTHQVETMCDEVLWLRNGEVAALGEPKVVVGKYCVEMEAETRRQTPAAAPPSQTPQGVELLINENRFGSLEMEIAAVRLLDEAGRESTKIASGKGLMVEIDYRALQPITSPIFSVTISSEDGFVYYDTSTASSGLNMADAHGQDKLRLQLERLDLMGGDYYVDVGVFTLDWSYAYDYHWHVYPLTVTSEGDEKGIIRPPHRWELS